MTREATSRSETASDTISRLDGVRRQRTIPTAAQTSELPITVPTMMNTNTHRINAERHIAPPPSTLDPAVVIVMVTSSGVACVQFVAMTSVALTTTSQTASHESKTTDNCSTSIQPELASNFYKRTLPPARLQTTTKPSIVWER